MKSITNEKLTNQRKIVRDLFRERCGKSHNIYYYNNKRNDGSRKIVFKSYGDKNMKSVWESVIHNLVVNKCTGWELYESTCDYGDGTAFGMTMRVNVTE